jgi:hypothetical protein
VNLYASRVKQYGRDLDRDRKRHADAVKKVSGLENEIGRLEARAAKASSESMQRNYLRQVSTKQGQLERARSDLVRRTEDVTKIQAKLAEAERNLRDAETKEREQKAKKDEQERRRQEQKERADRQRREREERQAERQRDAREAAREHDIGVLEHRATELEERLAAAERRAAPPEVTVLFLASSPEDEPSLRLDKETREIQKRIRTTDFRDSIWFEWRLARQLPDLIQDLNEVQPHILHFSGHGNRAELAFEDEAGNASGLDNDQLGRLLEAGAGRIRLIMFNSCDSAAQAELAVNHVELAIGMDATIGDAEAKTFAAQFYNSLGFGLSVGEAFRQATFQLEAVHGGSEDIPKLFAADGVDAETVVLVNPDEPA